MTTLYISLISIFGAMIFVRLPFVNWLKVYLGKVDLKPLDCSFCMTGWIALTLGLLFTQEVLYSIAICLVLPFITALTEYLYDKLNK